MNCPDFPLAPVTEVLDMPPVPPRLSPADQRAYWYRLVGEGRLTYDQYAARCEAQAAYLAELVH